MMHRRQFLGALSLLAPGLGLVAQTAPASAELSIRVGPGSSFQPMPIAVTDFAGEAQAGQQMAGVITNNLKRSGYFLPVDKARFPERAPSIDAVPAFQAWAAAGVQALVTGRVTRDGSGQLRTEFRLWDVLTGQQIVGERYVSGAADWRRIAHVVSDAVYSKITGLGGFFDTKVVFVDESGPKENRNRRLAVMDQDGANVRYLRAGQGNVGMPRYSPAGQMIAYISQRIGDPARVSIMNMDTEEQQLVVDAQEMTTSPRFTPDGSRVVITLNRGGSSNLYLVDLRSRAATPLTDTSGIDTAASFSPDGSQIVFESNRGGSQQIYLMGASGGGARRISFGEGGAYGQPVWSPRGDFIAFTRQRGGSFAIGIMKPDGTGERILTEGFHNEAPTWAPNGQYIMFYRDPGGQGGGKLYMVDITGRVEVPVPTPGFASEPAWSPLLTEARR